MWGFNVFVHSVNSNYVSFGQIRPHTRVLDFMQMLRRVWDRAVIAKIRPGQANGVWLPLEKALC